jgi:type II secretory pathway component PulL
VEASGLGHGSAASQPADTLVQGMRFAAPHWRLRWLLRRKVHLFIYLFIYFSKYECFVLPVVTARAYCMEKKKKDLIRYSAKIFIRFVLVLDVDEGGNVLQTWKQYFYMNR